MSITTITQISVQAGRLRQFLALIEANAAETRGFPGCISFDYLTNPENPDQVVFIEVWDSEGAQESYLHARVADGSMDKLGAFFSGPPVTSILQPAD